MLPAVDGQSRLGGKVLRGETRRERRWEAGDEGSRGRRSR